MDEWHFSIIIVLVFISIWFFYFYFLFSLIISTCIVIHLSIYIFYSVL